MLRTLLFLLVVTTLAASTPCLAVDELVYTGDLFAPFAQANFCAQAFDGGIVAPGAPIIFEGTTLWGGTRTAGPVTTNSVGRACIKALWPVDIYEMYVLGTGPSAGIESAPVAVTIFNPDWAGVFAGGRLCLDGQVGPPSECGIVECRPATFGIFDRTIEGKKPTVGEPGHPKTTFVGKPARLLFLDPFNPLGAVRIAAQNYKTDLEVFSPKPGTVQAVPKQGAIAEMYGYCWFQQGDMEPVWAHFDAYLEVIPSGGLGAYLGNTDGGVISDDSPCFGIRVWKYPFTILYEAEGCAVDGGAYLKCTGGHKPPPP